MPTDPKPLGEREYCDGDHDWKRVGTVEWSTSYEDLNERFETGVYECTDCDAKRWSKEEKPQQKGLDEWGAA